jgi:hypothetical protein
MSNLRKVIIAAAVILVIGGAVFALKGRPVDGLAPAGATAGDAAVTGTVAAKISKADHDAFVASAIPSCQQTASQNPNIVKAGISSDAIEKYCRCVAEKSADVISQNELTYIVEQKTVPASFETKTRDIAASCGAENLKPAK